ncbi:MAG: hypothetical protein HOP29_11060 [Phycisphaerales bacterium]|nr:hypothetical protein [Phycisphaerales bacterium]
METRASTGSSCAFRQIPRRPRASRQNQNIGTLPYSSSNVTHEKRTPNCDDAEALKTAFWKEAEGQGIAKKQFDRVVFIFAKDRLENWIEFLETGSTDESKEGPRVKHNRTAADAAKKLAEFRKAGESVDGMTPSLQWSCGNWRALAERMR